MGRFGFDFAFDAQATVRGGLPAGIYLNGSYVGGTDTVTENASYTIEYFEIEIVDGKSVRHPATGFSTQVETLVLGPNAYTITSAYGNDPVTGTLYLSDQHEITTTGGTAIGQVPVIEGIVGTTTDVWDITVPNVLIPSWGLQSPITEGENTVFTQYSDANGDVFVSSNSITIQYTETAPIVSIDGIYIPNEINTENYEVDVEYLYGGSLVEYEGALVTYIGGAVWYGGTIVTVTDYPLLPAQNQVQIIGETDDFGNTFNTTIELATKIPAIVLNANFKTTVSLEELGTNQYTPTNGLTIDTGAPYQTTATPTEAPYIFNQGFTTYNETASYTYPSTSVSNSIPVDITYNEFDVPKILELDGNDVTLGQIPKNNIAGGGTISVKWLNGSNVEQNDTDPVVAHEFATEVTVTRETTATAKYSHKTGIPVATLLYYRDDVGTRVDFNGTYEIPDTVVNQPITFGWSVTNGNVVGEVEQTEFTQTLTPDSANDVIMPAFTDDWGNSIPVGDRTQAVQYGDSLKADIIIDFRTGQTVGVLPSSIQSTGSDTSYAMDGFAQGDIVDDNGFKGFSMEDVRFGAPKIDTKGGGTDLIDPWLKSNQTVFIVYKRRYGAYSPILYGPGFIEGSQGFDRRQNSTSNNFARLNYSQNRTLSSVADNDIIAECTRFDNLVFKYDDTRNNNVVDGQASNAYTQDRNFAMGADNQNVVALVEIWNKAFTDQECADRLAELATEYGTTPP